jgi:hypothetical protein
MKKTILIVLTALIAFLAQLKPGIAADKKTESRPFELDYTVNYPYWWASPTNVIFAYELPSRGLRLGLEKIGLNNAYGRTVETLLDSAFAIVASTYSHEYWGHAETYYEMSGQMTWVVPWFFNGSWPPLSNWGAPTDLSLSAYANFVNYGDAENAIVGINTQFEIARLTILRDAGAKLSFNDSVLRIVNNLSLAVYMIGVSNPLSDQNGFEGEVNARYDPNCQIVDSIGPMFSADYPTFLTTISKSDYRKVLIKENQFWQALWVGGIWQVLGSALDFYNVGRFIATGKEIDLPKWLVLPETTLTPVGVEYGLRAFSPNYEFLASAGPNFQSKKVNFEYPEGGWIYQNPQTSLPDGFEKNKVSYRFEAVARDISLPRGFKIGGGVEYYQNIASGWVFKGSVQKTIFDNFALGVKADWRPTYGFSPEFNTINPETRVSFFMKIPGF